MRILRILLLLCVMVTVVLDPRLAFSQDLGPVFTGSIPPPAQLAGFTTMALNMDFTNASTDSHGVNWQNTATWLSECGAPTLYNNTEFHIYFNNIFANSGNGAVGPAPCSRIQIVNDGGSTVMEQFALNSDQPANGGGGLTAFEWPSTPWGTGPCAPSGAPNCAGGPNGQGLYQQSFIQITWRPGPEIYRNDVAPAGDSDPNFFWVDGCSACTDIGSVNALVAGFEIQGFLNGDGTLLVYTDGNGSTPGGASRYDSVPFQAGPALDIDPMVYHTTGILQTYDGSNQVHCVYWDSGITTGTPIGCYGWTGAPRPGPWGILSNHLGYCQTGWPTAPSAPCYSADLHFFIKSIQIWTCASYWTKPCIGDLVTSANDTKTRFARFESARMAGADRLGRQ